MYKLFNYVKIFWFLKGLNAILTFLGMPRMCTVGRFCWQRTKSARIEGRCITAWYKGHNIFMRLGEMFTGAVLQSHRKESKREGEIFFFLTTACWHSPSALSHASLHPGAHGKQHTGKAKSWKGHLKVLRFGYFSVALKLSIWFSSFFERLASAAADFCCKLWSIGVVLWMETKSRCDY